VFMWDNLKSHFDDELANLIYAQGHGIVPRPPYSPAPGPIEYI
jgi:transposase